jgi:tetratricopeptide (TPR) repeat protein
MKRLVPALTLILVTFSLAGADDPLQEGKRLLKNGNADAAMARFEEAIRNDPKSSDARLWQGRALLEKLQKASGLDQALIASRVKAAFEKAVELDPKNVDARVSLAGYYVNAPFIAGGSFKKAKKQAEAIVAVDPLRGHLLLGEIHVQEKEWPEAEAALKKALAIEPQNAQAHYSLGRVYQEAERWPAATSSFEKAVDLDPHLGQAWYQIGRTGAVSGQNLDRALEALDRYLEKHAASGGPVFHAGAWWRRGEILAKKEEYEKAIAAYRESLAIRPDERVRAALDALTR